MALVAMHDYVGGLEDLKVAMGYGLPKQYPLGINGLSGPYSLDDALQDFTELLHDDPNVPKQFVNAINTALNSGNADAAQKLMAKYRSTKVAPATTEPAPVDFGPFPSDSTFWLKNPVQPVYIQKDPYYRPANTAIQKTAQPGQPSKITDFFDNLSKFVTGVAPAFKGMRRPGRGKTVIQKDPDYTTYAVIGGAVIVASVLAIAVGKSGRKRD